MDIEPRAARPRIGGQRLVEILETTVQLLTAVGYDRLSLDDVATLAATSKATLYRHWQGKSQLVIDALAHAARSPLPETGSLAGDLAALVTLEPVPGADTASMLRGFLAIVTPLASDPRLHVQFSRTVTPLWRAQIETLVARARVRGEVGAHHPVNLLEAIIIGVALSPILYSDPICQTSTRIQTLERLVTLLECASPSCPVDGAV